jgi:hypothetical protein
MEIQSLADLPAQRPLTSTSAAVGLSEDLPKLWNRDFASMSIPHPWNGDTIPQLHG